MTPVQSRVGRAARAYAYSPSDNRTSIYLRREVRNGVREEGREEAPADG